MQGFPARPGRDVPRSRPSLSCAMAAAAAAWCYRGNPEAEQPAVLGEVGAGDGLGWGVGGRERGSRPGLTARSHGLFSAALQCSSPTVGCGGPTPCGSPSTEARIRPIPGRSTGGSW